MTATLERIEQDALSLTKEQRACLADRLLSSLGGEVLSDVDYEWVKEAECRYAEYKTGARRPIPAAKVFDDADQMLK